MNQAGIFIQVICAVLAGMILSYLLANGRRCKVTYSYMLCISLLLLWNIAEILLLMSSNREQQMLALKIKFLPVVYIGVSWLYFCMTITEHRIIENRLFKAVLILVPAICYVFLLTNESHHLFFRKVILKTGLIRGPVFWVHTIESYLCIIAGTIIFINNLRKINGKLGRNILFTLALLAPLTANILMLTNVIPNNGFDITSQLLLVTLIIFGIAVYRKKFLNLIPVAARHFIENMSDGIVIIDNENKIVGLNDAINTLFPDLKLRLYDSAQKLSEYIRNNATGDSRDKIADAIECSKSTVKGNLRINGIDIYLEIGVFTSFKKFYNGRMLIIEDRSEEQQLLNEIQNKNMQLTEANERLTLANKMLTEANYRLEQYSKTAEELAITRERNRMGREVHDTVGHTLTLLIALAENIKSKLPENQKELHDMLDKSIDISRQALNDIRSCLKGMCEESVKNTDLAEWLKDLTNSHLFSGTKVEVSISDTLPALDASKAMTIYRICQESVTNAIRHGQARTVNIIIKGNAEGLKIYIIDDGKGCSNIVKGYGLTGMEERVARLGGNITFGSDGEKGFNVIVNLPV